MRDPTVAAESTAPTRGGAARLIADALPLAAILGLAVELRLIFYQGVIHTDDIFYSHLARGLAEGVSPFAQPLLDQSSVLRIALYGPVALLYRLFGANDVTTLAWPFACSLLSIIGAYVIGRIVCNATSGLFAAFLLAILPTSVAASTALLGDGPLAMWCVGTVLLLLVSNRTNGRQRAGALVGSLACFVLGVLTKPLILLLLPFIVFYLLARLRRSFVTIAGLVAVAVVATAAYVLYFGLARPGIRPDFVMSAQRLALTATDVWQKLVATVPEFSWIAPLWIVAVVALIAWRRRESGVILSWLGLTFLYGELGTRTLTVYTPIVWYDGNTPARHLLLFAVPVMILTGIYLAQGVRDWTARWIIMSAALVTGVVARIGSRGAANLTWGVTGENLTTLPFVTISGIATIVVVYFGIASPAVILARSIRLRVAGTAALVVAVGLASLNYSYRAANEFRNPWVETMPDAVKFLAMQPPLPVFVPNELSALRLDYLSSYQFGFRSAMRPFLTSGRIQVAPADSDAVMDAFVLVDDFALRSSRDQVSIVTDPPLPAYLWNRPANWVEVADFGKYPTNHLKVYRVSNEMALADLAKARSAFAASGTPASLLALMTAAAGARAPCEAVRAWHELRVLSPQDLGDFNPVAILSACYKASPVVAGPNLFVNGDFAQGLAGWAKHPDADATVSVELDTDATPMWHGIYRGKNWSMIGQGVRLKPDTAYIYEATIKSTVPVISLYWQTDIGRHFEDKTYADWTTLRYVFVTPHWDGKPLTGEFAPVLMPGPGEVRFKSIRISELTKPPS